MPLTPLDIRNKTFRRSLRGYNEEEVDAFLEQIMREFEQLIRDNAALREQVETYSARLEQYENLENTLHNALVVAQQAADEVRAAARREAELTLEEARLRAEAMVREAREEVERVRRDAGELFQRARTFRAQLRGMLLAHLDLLEREGEMLSAGFAEVPGGAGEAGTGTSEPAFDEAAPAGDADER